MFFAFRLPMFYWTLTNDRRDVSAGKHTCEWRQMTATDETVKVDDGEKVRKCILTWQGFNREEVAAQHEQIQRLKVPGHPCYF